MSIMNDKCIFVYLIITSSSRIVLTHIKRPSQIIILKIIARLSILNQFLAHIIL
jgi:hypothetical protein